MQTKKGFHPSWIEVDLDQLCKNIAIIRKHIGERLYCLVVKANAYGHGLVEVSKTAEKAGVDYLAVAHLQEGMTLRQHGIKIPILVLGAIHEDQIADLIDYDLEFTISSQFKADLVKNVCQTMNKTCKVHLEVETGIQRTGVRPETAISLFTSLKNSPYFNVIGIYSHLAFGDNPFTKKQLDAFYQLLDHPIFQDTLLIRHIANSGGVVHQKHSYLDMVRPAYLTLGYLPKEYPPSLEGIAPCFSLKSTISYFKVVASGSGISYDHTFKTNQQTRIVTIPIGYGDGYRRALSNQGSVLIRGQRFPIVGTICMDQFMVDIGNSEAYVGDEVVLIGKQGYEEISLAEVADLCSTIGYEILCLLNDRIPRVYRASAAIAASADLSVF